MSMYEQRDAGGSVGFVGAMPASGDVRRSIRQEVHAIIQAKLLGVCEQILPDDRMLIRVIQRPIRTVVVIENVPLGSADRPRLVEAEQTEAGNE